MSRSLLSLFRLDRKSLMAFSAELKDVLARDDHARFASLLGLSDEQLPQTAALVGWMLRPDDDPDASPLFLAVRRAAMRRALELVWTSEAPSLEGRLRAYDVLREDEDVAHQVDRLLDLNGLPWFLQIPASTGGWLPEAERVALASALEELGPSLPDEVNAFVEALGGMDGDALLHDRLASR